MNQQDERARGEPVPARYTAEFLENAIREETAANLAYDLARAARIQIENQLMSKLDSGNYHGRILVTQTHCYAVREGRLHRFERANY